MSYLVVLVLNVYNCRKILDNHIILLNKILKLTKLGLIQYFLDKMITLYLFFFKPYEFSKGTRKLIQIKQLGYKQEQIHFSIRNSIPMLMLT